MKASLAILLAGMSLPIAADAQSVARGKYIVEQVGMCHDCHTPRDQTGTLIESQRLRGAPIGFRPLHPMPFAEHAPALAGIPSHYSPAQLAVFLETGKRPDGSVASPPMPQYRLSKDDAWAVVNYLKTVH